MMPTLSNLSAPPRLPTNALTHQQISHSALAPYIATPYTFSTTDLTTQHLFRHLTRACNTTLQDTLLLAPIGKAKPIPSIKPLGLTFEHERH